MGRKAKLVSTLLAVVLRTGTAAAGGEILGNVKGDDGTAIAGAIVTLTRSTPSGTPLTKAFQWTAQSTANGTFEFDLLPVGQYTLCAQAPSGNWLNACEWSIPLAVTLATTIAPANATILMAKGAVVPIRVNDPSGFLSQSGGGAATHILIGVRSPALIFHPATVTTQDSSGRNYAVTVPFGGPLQLVIASSFFQLENASGAALTNGSALASGAAISINLAPGQTPATVSLTVVGHK